MDVKRKITTFFIVFCIFWAAPVGAGRLYMRANYLFWGEGRYGESILLELPGKDEKLDTDKDRYVLIDGGSNNNTGIQNFLENANIDHIHYMVISHDHWDHYAGLATLVENGWTVDYIYECGDFDRVEGNKQNISDVEKGDILSGPTADKGPGWDDNVKVEVLWGGPEKDNDKSMVLKVSLGSSTFIFGGDLEDNESELKEEDLSDIQIYKVHHHGSDSSSDKDFLQNLDLKYAVQQDGGGSQHPYEDPLTRIQDAGAIIYRNDLDGHITVRADSEGNYGIIRETLYPDGRNPSGDWQAAPPQLPEGLAVTENDKYYIELSWDETSWDEKGEPIDHMAYHVFRATVSGGDRGAGTGIQPGMSQDTGIYRQLTLTPVERTTFRDDTVGKNTEYYYRISGVRMDYAYERRYSNEVKSHTHFEPPGKITDLTVSKGPSDREIKLKWTSPGEIGYEGDNRAGALYKLKYSTFGVKESTEAASSWWDKADAYLQTWEVKPSGTQHTEILKDDFRFNTTYYFGLKTTDAFGNTSVISSTPLSGSPPQVDVTAPRVVENKIYPSKFSASVEVDQLIYINFDQGMASSTVKDAVSIRAIKDNLTRSLKEEDIEFTFVANSSAAYSLGPVNPLEKGYTYMVSVTTRAKDLATITHPGDKQHPLESGFSWEFTVLMDQDIRNRIISSDGTKIEVPGGTFSRDYRVSISTVDKNSDQILESLRNLKTRDPDRVPLSLRKFEIYDDSQNLLTGDLDNRVKISIPFTPDNRYEKKTASLWRLDGRENAWFRIPEYRRGDTKILGEVSHLSVFGVLAESATDLSSAFAYPVPYQPADGNPKTGTQGVGIKFKNFSSRAQIDIYTLNGEHIRTLDYNYNRDGEPFIWDTRDKNGYKVASGLYFYTIENEKENVTGRLVIVR